MVLSGLERFTVGVTIPVGFGHAAFIFSSPIGTPEFVTTIGVDLDGVGGNFVGAADHLFDAYNEAFMGTTSTQLNLDRVTLTIGVDGGGNGSVNSTRSPQIGGDTGGPLPLNIGGILRKQTNLLGRAGRGRMFMPALINSTQVSEGGTIDSPTIEGINEVAADFLAWIQAPDTPDAPVDTITPMQPVLLHDGARVPTPITTLSLAPLIGVQRKRIR